MKMKLKIVTVAALIAAIFTVELAQSQIRIGAKAGYSIGKISDNSDNIYTEEFKSTDGIDAGITAEFVISELFSIQTELLYTQRGGERNGLQPIPTSELVRALEENGLSIEQLDQLAMLQGRGPVTNTDPLYAVFDSETRLEYLEIPLMGKLGWGTDWRFYVEAGPYIGFLLSSKQVTGGDSQFYLDSSGNVPLGFPNPLYPNLGPEFIPIASRSFEAQTATKDQLNDINFGFHAGAGLVRKLNEKHSVYLGFRGSWGGIALQKDKDFGETKIGGLVFSFGYYYTL
jgi:hypothetical protein